MESCAPMLLVVACMLMVVGLIAAILGLNGVAAVAVQLAGVLFVIEMVLELVLHLTERRTGQIA